jgi:hypothetical protein
LFEERARKELTALVSLGGSSAWTATTARLCEEARVVLEAARSDRVVVDLGPVVDPDVATVETLARLQLTAVRLGKRIAFRNACGEMCTLVTLMGLDDALPVSATSRLEPRRETEQREQLLGVEEEADP